MAHYISNKEFTAAIVAYIKLCEEEEAQGREPPQIPKDIAKQFIALANKLGSRYNFVNYTFKDEMVSSAIFACCAKIRKFNILVSDNAFAYFTNVCWRAMVDVINYEEKMSYVKAKSYQYVDYENSMDDSELAETGEYGGSTDFIPFFDIDEYEKKMAASKERSKASAKQNKAMSDSVLDVD